MVTRPDGEKSLTICVRRSAVRPPSKIGGSVAVLTECRRVTDRQTDGRHLAAAWHSPRYAYASHDKNGKKADFKPTKSGAFGCHE